MAIEGLYLVTDRSLSLGRPLKDIVAAAVRGGVGMVQLREKDTDSREFVELARSIKQILAPAGVPLIINDRADIALIASADGLHIGQRDISFPDTRALMGPDAIIGLSVENEAQAIHAAQWDLDYIAASPVFNTPTKTDTAEELGLEGLSRIKKLVSVPLVAIGGINESNIAQVHKAGADSIAIVSAISSAVDPEAVARKLLEFMQQ